MIKLERYQFGVPPKLSTKTRRKEEWVVLGDCSVLRKWGHCVFLTVCDQDESDRAVRLSLSLSLCVLVIVFPRNKDNTMTGTR